MKTYLITGVCGFIGSNLAAKLLAAGNRVIGVNKATERNAKVLEQIKKNPNFTFYEIDLAFFYMLDSIVETNIDTIFHLAANADVRFSHVYPEKDLNDGIIATYNLLRWAKDREIKQIAYSSTSALYGDPSVIPTPENYFPTQTSFYGASKLAGEAMLQAHCAAYDTRVWIFRFASITGPGYSHGFIYNFYRELLKNPNELYVHGGKEQQKTYLDVDDCINAMLTIVDKAKDKVNTFNLGNSETIGLPDSIPIITNHMGLNPKIVWSGNEVGWIGDSKINNLDTTKLESLGWKPNYNIHQTIKRTLNWLDDNQWILSLRGEI
jgi:UDP-glucose 4-epimerase